MRKTNPKRRWFSSAKLPLPDAVRPQDPQVAGISSSGTSVVKVDQRLLLRSTVERAIWKVLCRRGAGKGIFNTWLVLCQPDHPVRYDAATPASRIPFHSTPLTHLALYIYSGHFHSVNFISSGVTSASRNVHVAARARRARQLAKKPHQ
jgi:hypothetical protein